MLQLCVELHNNFGLKNIKLRKIVFRKMSKKKVWIQ